MIKVGKLNDSFGERKLWSIKLMFACMANSASAIVSERNTWNYMLKWLVLMSYYRCKKNELHGPQVTQLAPVQLKPDSKLKELWVVIQYL